MFVNRNAKLLSLVLSIIFIFAVIVPSRASAFDNDSLQVDTCDELSMEELQKMSLSADELPQIIDWSIAEKNGNVYRLYSQEDDLNSAIFQNKDGSKTMYYFGEPIKYTAEDGTIQDKSNRIATSADSSEDNYTYYTPQNDIQTFFPEVLGTGADVFLKAEGFQLSFSPVSQGAFAGTLTTTKGFDSIQYRDVFGKEWVSFELKNAIPTWQNNVSAADRGVMLRNSNETSTSASKTLCSTESSYKPYVSLTWFGSDPAGISSGNIYRLRNTFSSRYLSASSPTYFQQAISMNTTRGNDLWRFDRVSSGVYRIESLGVRCDSTGLQPSMLTASAGGSTSTSGTLSLTAYSSSNTRQWWYVTKNTQGYSLVSYYYPQLAITVSSATSAPTLSSNANHPKWTMTSASFSNYWSGAYSGGSSPYTINVIVESSAVTGYLTQSVYSCATAWNGIDSNIFIRHYPSTYTGSYASADFTVRVRGVNSYGKRFGRLVPTPNNVNQNWTSAVIEISTESSSTNNSSYTHTDRQMNFLHELGHALKLAHPHESDSSWHPLSIMNQGLPSTRDYIPGRPSGYDKYNLSRKW